MQNKYNVDMKAGLGILLTGLAALLLSGCGGGGGGGGSAVTAVPQIISFGAAPALSLSGTATVSATASSGLAVSYSSTTPAVCSVNSNSGVVTDIAAGTCIIAANQPGSAGFAPAVQVTQSIAVLFNPNQTISFSAVPALTLFGHATVLATATSGLAVSYSSTTPAVCSVNSSTGDVTDLTAGVCTVAANQAGNVNYIAAPQVTQSMTVATWVGPVTAPGSPTGVTATAGVIPNTVTVSFTGPASSGGSLITGYNVTSIPAGLTASGIVSPITVTCTASCSSYAFSVQATNAIGNSVASAPADVITTYNVTETFYEPMTQPNNSIFTGSFILNSTTNTVSSLSGTLTESMVTPMTMVPLKFQLSAVSDGLGGLLVTTFANNNTNTFTTNPLWGGTNGWAPGSGQWLYFGRPGPNPANAYAMIYVNLANPTGALTPGQINNLAYADCTPLGMMGEVCMTGTTVAGYGTIGSMSGYPVSQTITKK